MSMRVLAVAALVMLWHGPAGAAEVDRVRVGRGPGFSFLNLYVLEHEKLLEKQARAAGLGELRLEMQELTGGAVMNDALLSGNMEIANGGVPPFLILWARALGTTREVRAIGATMNSASPTGGVSTPSSRPIMRNSPYWIGCMPRPCTQIG